MSAAEPAIGSRLVFSGSVFHGSFGGEWNVVATTVGGSSLSTQAGEVEDRRGTHQQDPLITQEDGETILVRLQSYSGFLRLTKGKGFDAKGELRLSFDATNLILPQKSVDPDLTSSETSLPGPPMADKSWFNPLDVVTPPVESTGSKVPLKPAIQNSLASTAKGGSHQEAEGKPLQQVIGVRPDEGTEISELDELMPPEPDELPRKVSWQFPATKANPDESSTKAKAPVTSNSLHQIREADKPAATPHNDLVNEQLGGSIDFTKLMAPGSDWSKASNHSATGTGVLLSDSKKHWADHSFRPRDARGSDISRESSMSGDRISGLTRGTSTYGDWDPEESDYVSPLHEACDSPFVTMGELDDALKDSPRAVSKQDEDGRLPLHILANNRDLIVDGGEAGREMAAAFAKRLIKKYPAAVLTKDNEGRVPFTAPIQSWIEWTYSTEKGIDKSGGPTGGSTRNMTFGRRIVSKLISRRMTSTSTANNLDTNPVLMPLTSTTSSEIASNYSPESSLKRFPPAEITEDVEWCFEMLSLAMDLSGGKTASGISRPQLSYKKQLRDRETLAASVGSIPKLLKTILLLESNDDRIRLLNSSIIRRVLLAPESIGVWVTSMLRYRPLASRLAVDYFEIISNATVQDFIGEFRKPAPSDITAFNEARVVVFDQIYNLGGTIPSLVILEEKEIERAASTRAVYFVMSKSLTQPLVVALVMTDLVMQITLQLAFRSSIMRSDLAALSENLPVDGNKVILTICSYLLFRQVMDAIALFGISRKILIRHLLDSWNLVDISCVCFALASAILVGKSEKSPGRGILHAITLGLLWIRLLTFLKIVNERTAMFILALVQILRDARYFLVVFAAAIFLFSDMLYVLYDSDRENLCEGEIPPSSQDYCAIGPFNAYIRTYAIILGDLAVEDYRGNPAITVIFVAITFFAFVILLNVLIAVLSASYDQARRQSAILFRRARIEFVAGHTALESFITPRKDDLESRNSSRHQAFGFLILLSMLATTLVAEVFLVGSAWAIKDGDNALIFVIMYAILSVVLSLGVWGVGSLCFGSFLQKLLPQYAAQVVESADKLLKGVSRYAAVKLFGLSDVCAIEELFDDEDDLKNVGDEDEVAQLRWIRKELLKTEKSMKDRFQYTEDRLRRDLQAIHVPGAPGSRRTSPLKSSLSRDASIVASQHS